MKHLPRIILHFNFICKNFGGRNFHHEDLGPCPLSSRASGIEIDLLESNPLNKADNTICLANMGSFRDDD